MLICNNYNNAIRCKDTERLDHLYEQCCDRLAKLGKINHSAVVSQDCILSFHELDQRANQVARFFLKQGLKSGDRIGLLFDRSFQAYIALLAVLKINAAYVPLDGSFPKDRINYIVGDAKVRAIVTLSIFESKVKDSTVPSIFLDSIQTAIAGESKTRLSDSEKGLATSQLCYIIYTSGSTGNPKGVAVEHPSICNFVKVAAEVYGYTEADRVYQGMTIAFDFSVEELWVPLIAGATLVPGKADTNLVGRDLAEFLLKNKITALCCVPTLLATIEEDLPLLRFLLVSGEACPHDLVVRWHRKGRTILNAYGPTEATVTCTWTELYPQKPVTIGQPFPTYSIVILDAEKDEQVPKGQSGEICVAGIGLAKGYVNRDDLTERAFIPDFLDLPNNPSQRIYRTGDLGRITDDGEIEYQGRIDTQVKIRGYRIELTEIESVLLQLPQIAQAVVNTYAPEGGTSELAAYYTLKDEASSVSNSEFSELLRSHLPGYMIPTYIEQLSTIPMLPSNKADRKKLPPPKGPRFVARGTDIVAPKSETEKIVASTLADILQIDHLSVKDNFFEDLGAHSLLMAQFSAKLRETLNHPDVSMREIYMHPTVAQLAKYLDKKPNVNRAERISEKYRIPSNLEYYGCGTLQFLTYSTYFLFGILVLIQGIIWIFDGTTWLDLYVRIAALLAVLFVFSITLPVAMKWIIIGRWKAEKIPIWSLRYFRFWVVKSLISNNPMVMFKGLPLFNVYLRLLGAKIGKHVVFNAKHIPICTDLLTVGDGTLIRENTFMLGYKARGGYIYTGPISIGKNAYVGTAGVLDIHTVMEDNTQLGHVSSLQENQIIPAGKHYHGSPAEETTFNYCRVEPKKCTTLRRAVYTALQLQPSLFVLGPAIAALIFYWLRHWLTSGTGESFFSTIHDFILTFNLFELAIISMVLFFSSILLALIFISLVPRLFNLFLKEDRVYVLFGVHYWIYKAIRTMSNSKSLNIIFGDSSAVVHYLKLIGYDLSDRIVQSGSNFGVEQKHDNPLLCSFGTGTMVADGLSVSNIQMSSTSFKVKRTIIGADNYVGNDIQYPPDGKTGKNCLLGTKVMIPIDGEVRENVGLLGSPCFEIPRMVDRDRELSGLSDESVRKQHLGKKNVHNLITALSFLFWHWLFFFLVFALFYSAVSLYSSLGLFSFVTIFTLLAFFYIGYFIAIERTSMVLARLKPQITSIYDRDFWRIERYWKHSEDKLKSLFVGTPFKNIITRLSGAKIGKKVFDDGLALSEKPMVDIGDYCTFNAECGLQSHSLEEGVFKCDYIKMGAGCTVGINVLVHYGTTIGENVVIGQDSFLMKGETAESNSMWQGNPASESTSLMPAPISQEQSQETKSVFAKKDKLLKELSHNVRELESEIRSPEREISNTEAGIVHAPDDQSLEDSTSTPSTYVNGKPITETDRKTGDIIEIHNDQLNDEQKIDTALEKKITITSSTHAPASSRQSYAAKLIVTKQGKFLKEFSLNEDCLTIGRGPENDIRLPQRKISRAHARIVHTPNGHRLEDLISTHGTYVNSKRITEYDLKIGDIINIHDYQLSYKRQTDIASEQEITRTSPTCVPASLRQSHNAKLIVTKQGKFLKEFSLNEDCLTIGRGPENDIRLPQRKISRAHARIVHAPNGHRLEDLISTHGTYVNSKRITEYDLKIGDIISMHDYQLSYERQTNIASEQEITRTSPTYAPTSLKQSHDAKLIVTKKGNLLKEFSLNGDCLTIGRGPENDICLPVEGISRSHAKIVHTPYGHRVEDLISTNGTFVNGKRIKEYALEVGDVIKIIDYQISYKRELNAVSE